MFHFTTLLQAKPCFSFPLERCAHYDLAVVEICLPLKAALTQSLSLFDFYSTNVRIAL